MGKILLSIPDDMHQAFKDIAKREDKVMAAIIRRLIADYLLKEYGLTFDPNMPWGGSRKSDADLDAD